MPEKTKRKNDREKETEEIRAADEETDEQGNWSEDQRQKSYYYDDAHGYEIYNPEDDDDETEERAGE